MALQLWVAILDCLRKACAELVKMDGITEHTCSAKPCTCFCTLTFLHMLTHHTTSFTWHFLISCWKHLCQVPSLIHYRLFSCVSTLLVHYTVLSPLNRQGRNCFKSLACLEILSIANVLRRSLGNTVTPYTTVTHN